MILERIYLSSIDQSNAVNAAADRATTRPIMASFYADAMIADALGRRDGRERVDFAVVNAAILSRWLRSGLLTIKRLAWKLVETRTKGER